MQELQNFVNKFHQLWQAGFTTHLDVDAHAGQAWIHLHLMLESGPIQRPKHRIPSYLKRQERRKAARSAARNSCGDADAVKASYAKITEEVKRNFIVPTPITQPRNNVYESGWEKIELQYLKSYNMQCTLTLFLQSLPQKTL